MASVSQGNWTSYVQDFVKDKAVANYMVSGPDPFEGCYKEFSASYQCGALPNVKTIVIPGEAGGKTATFDCSAENQACSGFRLTLGDDGNLVLQNLTGLQLWTSNTNKTGLALDEFKAGKGKYGRNYLLAGDTLGLGEFMGSPSGNCYLIMAQGADGANGLQLNYSVANCTAQNFGNDEATNGLFRMAHTAYNELMGVQHKVEPNMQRLSKTLPGLKQAFRDNIHTVHTAIDEYTGLRRARPVVQKHINQLDAMTEDTSLFLIRYNYRRIAWFTLAILILVGGLKLAKKNGDA